MEFPAPAPTPGFPGLDASDFAVARQMFEEGASWYTIAAALNANGSRTTRGTRWHARSVARALLDEHRRRRTHHPAA